MDLRKEFVDAIEEAKALPSGERALHLHHAIVGPRSSGKSTVAREFAEALKNENLVDGAIAEMDFPALRSEQQRNRILKKARGGILIVDNPAAGISGGHFSTLCAIQEMMKNGACVVIFTGSKEKLQAAVKGEEMEKLLRKVILPRSYSPEEQRAYRRQQREELHRWDADVALKKRVKLLPTFHFKKNAP